MWVFCKEGFFSAVQHWDDPDKVMVRARFKGDLERVCQKHGLRASVEHTPDADYRYRVTCLRQEWAEVVKREAEGVDYVNFKDAVHDGTCRDDAYMACWSALHSAQHSGH